ncbi:aminofutalosine deaminase family hydrolase [Halarcobacter anaerophilus]|uniref:aminofutalosine deaminase family hydrolase n=1 Tax=Halarcobacter anaerophilus TaxID=877500 RepID=UPI0005C93FC2|nr:metal-dependent hydrolase [Halarcobacter anaerophilus]
MKILKASWVISCDENNTIIKDGAVAFDKKIIAVATEDFIKEKYPDSKIEDLGKNSVLMPGLINSHIHLEFSSNTTTLKYGNFMSWLNSVITSREKLVKNATKELIKEKLEFIKRSGTTTIGAISSYSFDLEPCFNSDLNVVYFSEVIGSKQDMIDSLFDDFKARLKSAKEKKREGFFPSIAIHSPYSVHPFLIRESLKIAKDEKMAVSTHFLESPEEFDWLHKDEGGFVEFFKNFLGQEKAVTKPMEFLNQFEGVKPLSFTHCVEASKSDLEKIKDLNAVINHCPTSNRVLNNSRLKIQNLLDLDIPFAIGTDGLSSNNSLSMFDELRNALMIHTEQNVVAFAKLLILAATKNGAKALGLNKGTLEKNADADLIAISLPDEVEDEEDLCLNIILHTKEVNKTVIGGNYV